MYNNILVDKEQIGAQENIEDQWRILCKSAQIVKFPQIKKVLVNQKKKWENY